MTDGTPETVLSALSEQFITDRVPVNYYQLDAYWYPFERANGNCKINDTEIKQYVKTRRSNRALGTYVDNVYVDELEEWMNRSM